MWTGDRSVGEEKKDKIICLRTHKNLYAAAISTTNVCDKPGSNDFDGRFYLGIETPMNTLNEIVCMCTKGSFRDRDVTGTAEQMVEELKTKHGPNHLPHMFLLRFGMGHRVLPYLQLNQRPLTYHLIICMIE